MSADQCSMRTIARVAARLVACLGRDDALDTIERALVGLLAHPDTTDPTPLHQALDALSGARDTHARKDP